MKGFLSCLVLMLAFNSAVYAHHDEQAVETLTLLGRAHTSGDTLNLSAPDKQWLHTKGSLVLGTSGKGTPPFELPSSKNDYEGLTADYTELLADLLQIEIKVRRYRDQAEAVTALKRGEVDLLGAGGTAESSDLRLVLSQIYADDQPVLVTRRDLELALPVQLKGLRLAMRDHYLTPSEVAGLYPEATLTSYPTSDAAMNAVAFGQADVYVGGGIGANYLIQKNRFNDLHLAAFAGNRQGELGFVLRRENEQLLRLVNRALDAVSLEQRLAITQRWKAVPVTVHGRDRIPLTPDEKHWLAANPKLKIAVLAENPPLAFLDQNQKFRGLSADVLEKISNRIPLQFDVVVGSSNDELGDMLLRGEVDMVTMFSAENPKLRLTRPYWSSPIVLVSRAGGGVSDSLVEMGGKRVVVFKNSRMVEYLRQFNPDIKLLLSDSAAESLSKLATGDADVAITTLLSAQHLISTYYPEQLRIIGSVSSQSAQLVFGIRRGEPELYSILNKVLMNIRPEEIDELTNRWFGNEVVERDYWQSHRWAIIRTIAVVLLVLVGAFYWIVYLRRLIGKRNAAESQLSEQVAFMRVLIDSLPHPILARDRQGRLLLCNGQYLRTLGGITYEQAIGTREVDCGGISLHDAGKLEQDYFDVMKNGEPRIEDRFFSVEEGKTAVIYHWILPFRDSRGDVQGVIAGWIDISERERLLNDLKITQLEAENANRAKTTFLATMSHEIRTPMNAIVGMLELAMKKADKGELGRFAIEVAFGAAQGLLGLIGDILDVVRIESGHLALTPQRAAFKPLVESIIRVFEGLARQKYLDLVLEFDAQADRDVCVDPLRFKQILSNLLSNAIKFTQEGKVVVSVRAALVSDGSRLNVRVHVRDTGIGISKEDQERLFVPFSQVGAADQDQRSGSGLGLMISRTLCSMMQGELNLHSVPGIGTQVDVVLELPVLEPLPPVKTEAVIDLSGRVLNVLVVDDYPANRLLLQQQLAYLGHNVSDEPDGAHGLKAWRSGRFDVVITDCNMPVMSGYELVRHIRAEEERSGARPCLVLGFTANAQVDEVDRCLAAGMDDCLFKPISMKALAARLSSAVPVFVQAPPEEGEPLALDGIDLTSLEQLTYGDRESIVHLLGDLAKSNEEDMSRLVKLFSDGDFSAIADLTHRIKGGARIIKAQGLIQCCEQVQQDCSDRNPAKLTQSVDELHQAMEALARMMATYIGEVAEE
ncbi:Hybrid sensory histidine kinase EvgS [Pseudomonas chlororaphis subsp. piscium]|uniref:transporter substrate-binding domain-containing protein n=2 Tax=Pseudomonas chlororaphis TaxID=587753 RepID=UPI000F57A87B|nr:transporter substrate-binding domain-containing protein [Pseudomonas chlororaphis]AZC50505.1 Hybrid sensory histidine kinase EvgS [Pseudomonas chlororaphis subsp. piscium]AZC75714.1 Hybrid sensory histidine kinase EvgS [Pseudomonas chlororaphis subsp. piscium]